MDKMCGNESIIFDGDLRPGGWFQLTSSSKYQPNFSCSIKFRAAQPTQRFVVTVEKMNTVDCPKDLLLIYDSSTLLNQDIKQQCGTLASFSFTTTTSQVTFTFTSGSGTKSSGFQVAIALHFPAVHTCPQNLGFFLCGNKNCISKQLECDSHNHCGDGTDEYSCSDDTQSIKEFADFCRPQNDILEKELSEVEREYHDHTPIL
ncbi:unnamed protein product [Rotaria socialis]|uniref:CUB domain-containing protein n=1 Tax=Rotaria socialis TaxID=392032 RepID=A0A819VNG3_9BILA|nr:unnamed protein product [Rotaria socialis]CAF4433870.1 unnamed protein product [Rotaria socialis]CAF4575059.1 unnamed protein product [Rotaria socialis]